MGLLNSKVVSNLKEGANVLDLASGYGRLSKAIKCIRNDVEFFGIDLSLEYCKHYKEIGLSICSDISSLPIKNNYFDLIILTTGLMYIEKNNLSSSLSNIFSKLRLGGVAFFCEPGLEVMDFIEKIRFKGSISETGGKGFYMNEFREIFEREDLEVLYFGSNLCLTLVMPICIIFRRFPIVSKNLAELANFIDSKLNFSGRFAMHRCILVRKRANGRTEN